LRSLYFAVAQLVKLFRFLHYGLAVVLVLVGLKMILSERFNIPTAITLGVVAMVIVVSIAVSMLFPERNAAA